MSKSSSFERIRTHVFALYGRRQYQEGLALSLKARRSYPREKRDTTYWVACFYSLVGDTEKSLRTLKEAVEGGLWWSPNGLLDEPDLKPLRDRREFQEVLEECSRLQRKAQRTSKPRLLVFSPRAGKHELPLLITLHGRNGNAREHAKLWKASTQHGLIYAAPQSSQMYSTGRFCWDDRDRGKKEVADAFRRIAKSRAIRKEEVMLGGFSQGGALAVRMALEAEPIGAKGFVCVSPALTEVVSLMPLIGEAVKRRVRGYLITGERDPSRPLIEELHRKLTSKGLACRLEVNPHLGHEYPENFPSTLSSAIEFLLH